MAENTTPQGETDQTPHGDAAEAQPVDTTPEIDWKAEARKHEKRAKENFERARANETAAKRLAEIEEAQKTEAEKTAERLAALEQENQKLKHARDVQTWTREIADATGVPADTLRGSTREEIEAHAEILKTALAAGSPEPSPAPPVPTLGNTPQTPGNVPIADQIAAAEAAGNTALVAALKAMQLGG